MWPREFSAALSVWQDILLELVHSGSSANGLPLIVTEPITVSRSDDAWLSIVHPFASHTCVQTDLADKMLSKKKGPRKPSKLVSSSFAGSSQAADEEQQINLLDSTAVKRELDEGAIRVTSKAFTKIQQIQLLPRCVNSHSPFTGFQSSWTARRPLCQQRQDSAGSHNVS